MAEAFIYRPKFVDIRVKKPATEEAARKPEERACDQAGCSRAGLHRAPKSRDAAGYWWFCAEHASEYNRRWNFFEGMSEEELLSFAAAEQGGHRPTWTFRAGRGDRLSAAHRQFERGRRGDPFGIFRGDGQAEPAERRRSVSRVQLLALEALGLEEGATPEAVRARYTELVKRYHPDSNGGDRSAESMLHKVIRAYQTLKASGLG